MFHGRTTAFTLVALMSACRTTAPNPQPGTVAPDPAATSAPAERLSAGTESNMVARGQTLYATHCADCHGASGQGSDDAPPVVGQDALPLQPRANQQRDAEFRTALDVFQWVQRHMPPAAPGSLSDDEYLAIMAFALEANGIELTGDLDAEKAAALVLHE